MTDRSNYDQYHFLFIQYSHSHQTDFSSGCPRHYFAKMMTGTAVIQAKNISLKLYPGDCFYIPKGIAYKSLWYPDQDNSISFYSFGCDSLPIANNEEYLLQKFNLNETSQKYFSLLIEDISVSPTSIAYLYLLFSEIRASLVKAAYRVNNTIVIKAMEYISNNTFTTIEDLANYCGVSKSGIYYLFSKYVGKSPVTIKNEILIARALDLLKGTDLPIEEISSLLNFTSSAYFRKVLFKQTGKTPSQIRKEAGL